MVPHYAIAGYHDAFSSSMGVEAEKVGVTTTATLTSTALPLHGRGSGFGRLFFVLSPVRRLSYWQVINGAIENKSDDFVPCLE